MHQIKVRTAFQISELQFLCGPGSGAGQCRVVNRLTPHVVHRASAVHDVRLGAGECMRARGEASRRGI